MSDKINFRYDESFQLVIANNFKKLMNEDEFYDVTLVSDDQIHFSAHKLVLSSSSSYFKNILKKTKHSHPLLCLDGIRSRELKDVLQYIYNGEVNVAEDHIDRFLGIALKLKLEGLSKKDKSEAENQKLRNKVQGLVSPSNPSVNDVPYATSGKKESIIMTEKQIEEEGSDTVIKIENPRSIINEGEDEDKINNEENLQNSSDIIDSTEIEQKIQESYEKSKDNLFQCKLCTYSTKQKGHIREHIDIHYDFQYHCNKCDKVLKTKQTLRHHEATHRKENLPFFAKDKKLIHLLNIINNKNVNNPEQRDLSTFVVEDHTGENLSLSEIEEKQANYMEKNNGRFMCKVCQHYSHNSGQLREHLDKHIKFRYNCNQCDKNWTSKCTYRKHMSQHRKQSV